MKSKGQVTLFFLVGVILLILLLFIFYLQEARNTVGVEQSLILPTTLSLQAKAYISSCLDVAFYDALESISANGGYFLDGTNDLIPLSSISRTSVSLGGATQPVAYGLMQPSVLDARELGLECEFEEIFEEINGVNVSMGWVVVEPCDTYEEFVRDQPSPYETVFTGGFFGVVTFPKLCEQNGANSKIQNENPYCHTQGYTKSIGEHSIQGAFEQFILQTVTSCMQRGNDAALDSSLENIGLATARLAFGKQTTSVTLEFSTQDIDDITQTYSVRLLALYDYMLATLLAEAKDLFHTLDPVAIEQQNPYFKTGFSHQVRPSSQGTLLTFVDAQSTYQGNSLLFNTFVQERRFFNDSDAQQYEVQP